VDCLDGTNSDWKVSCSALNRHSTKPARTPSWTFQEPGETLGSRPLRSSVEGGGGGGEGVDTWILGSQLKWFRQVPLQESICPLLDLTPCPIIWRKSGLSKEEGSFKEEEGLFKEMEAKMASYNIIKIAAYYYKMSHDNIIPGHQFFCM
jgi:hypothetical protein